MYVLPHVKLMLGKAYRSHPGVRNVGTASMKEEVDLSKCY